MSSILADARGDLEAAISTRVAAEEQQAQEEAGRERVAAAQRARDLQAAAARQGEERATAQAEAERRATEEAAARARAQEQARAETAARNAERERRLQLEEERARLGAVKAVRAELDRAGSFLATEEYDEAFEAASRALKLDPTSAQAIHLVQEVLERVPKSQIHNPDLAMLVFKPEVLDPPPVKIPEKYRKGYVLMRGIVSQYLKGIYIVRNGDNVFAFSGDGDWAVSVGQFVFVIGKDDGEFDANTVLGVAQSFPLLHAVAVFNN